MTGTQFTLEVQPRIPASLSRLEELANDLLYTWDRNVRSLFYRMDNELWEAVHHSPKLFLRRIAQQKLDAAAKDRIFLDWGIKFNLIAIKGVLAQNWFKTA